MLIRICLIGAIVFSLAVAGVNFFMVKDKITALGNDRNHEKEMKEGKIRELAATNAVLVKTTADLNKTKGELASAISARDAAVAKADEQSKRADGLAADLKATTEKLNTTSDQLAAWVALGIPITQARQILNSLNEVKAQMAAVNDENQVLYGQYKKLWNKLEGMLGHQPGGPAMPDDLRGKVLAVDPKYNFILLDVGQKQGAQERGQLLISRDGKLVGEAVITGSIESNRCVANVMAGWDENNIHEGDVAIAANVEK